MRSRYRLAIPHPRRATSVLAVATGFLAAGWWGPGLRAQQVRVLAPVAVQAGGGQAANDDGPPVEMFENANLDRYLRRAEDFLQRADYAAAISVLQDVAEGKTPVEVGIAEAVPAPPAETVQPTAPEKPARSRGDLSQEERFAVFASDGRLYRPVRRLGQEMLANMPENGIELYRTMYDAEAERLFAAAVEEGSIHALQGVVDRFYVSLPAGRAMALLADRCMQEGRYRGAVQVLRDLLTTYPQSNRKKLGIDDTWLHFKVALCLAFAGERDAAHEAAVALAGKRSEDSLRILGELQSVKELPEQRTFRTDTTAAADVVDVSRNSWLQADTDTLVPLWQYRFVDPDPYREPKSAKGNNNYSPSDDVVQNMAMPFAGRYYPGTHVQFADLGLRSGLADVAAPRVAFLEHYRLRVANALTGVVLAEGDGVVEPSAPRDGYPRIRIATTDYAQLRTVEDRDHVYAVLGFSRKVTTTTQVFRATELVAYDRRNLQRVWSSADWSEGDAGLRDVTFLAAPTVFGERLFLPSLRRDVYALECLERSTGKLLWATPLHSGGSDFFKAPGARVLVEGGTAFVLTNSGCMGAVDAFTGDLRWIRRYERNDPLRPVKRPKSPRERDPRMMYGRIFTQQPLTGFFPSDVLAHNGLLVIAPVDSDVLLCIDGASGQPAWLLDATSRYVPFGRLRVLVGAIGDDLFACSDTHLVCVSLRGGLVRWAKELPGGDPKTTGRGRGAIVGEHVVLPGNRELMIFEATGKEPMRRLRLPEFGAGREPLDGSFHVASLGPWLAVGYAGGVEMFSSPQALRATSERAADPFVKASLLLRAGKRAEAERVWKTVLSAESAEPAALHRARKELLGSVRERALQAAAEDVTAGLRMLDELDLSAAARELRMDWHLARLDCCKAGDDLRRLETEQQALYDYMEGRR